MTQEIKNKCITIDFDIEKFKFKNKLEFDIENSDEIMAFLDLNFVKNRRIFRITYYI